MACRFLGPHKLAEKGSPTGTSSLGLDYLAEGIPAMDEQTIHELWIVTVASLVPIPLVTAIAVIAGEPQKPHWGG